jgi:hypothetical protein
VVSNRRGSGIRRKKGGFQERFHKNERTQKDEELRLGSDGLKKYQNTKAIGGEKETLGGRVQHR